MCKWTEHILSQKKVKVAEFMWKRAQHLFLSEDENPNYIDFLSHPRENTIIKNIFLKILANVGWGKGIFIYYSWKYKL